MGKHLLITHEQTHINHVYVIIIWFDGASVSHSLIFLKETYYVFFPPLSFKVVHVKDLLQTEVTLSHREHGY